MLLGWLHTAAGKLENLTTHHDWAGSDLIYNISAAKAVAETMAMLSKPGTICFLCNPGTHAGLLTQAC